MAGFRLPAASIVASCSPNAVRAAPRIGQAFRPRLSHASCFWANNQHSRALLRLQSPRLCQVQRTGLFSTSRARQTKKDEELAVGKKTGEVGRIFSNTVPLQLYPRRCGSHLFPDSSELTVYWVRYTLDGASRRRCTHELRHSGR
jgi:hypothetical protein